MTNDYDCDKFLKVNKIMEQIDKKTNKIIDFSSRADLQKIFNEKYTGSFIDERYSINSFIDERYSINIYDKPKYVVKKIWTSNSTSKDYVFPENPCAEIPIQTKNITVPNTRIMEEAIPFLTKNLEVLYKKLSKISVDNNFYNKIKISVDIRYPNKQSSNNIAHKKNSDIIVIHDLPNKSCDIYPTFIKTDEKLGNFRLSLSLYITLCEMFYFNRERFVEFMVKNPKFCDVEFL